MKAEVKLLPGKTNVSRKKIKSENTLKNGNLFLK